MNGGTINPASNRSCGKSVLRVRLFFAIGFYQGAGFCPAPCTNRRYGVGETTTPLPLDARQMLESAGPVSNGNVIVFDSVELKAST
jgi:hypothetical protein